MKKSKWLAITGLTVMSTLILAACGNSNASNTYSYVYSNDPDTLDYVNSNRATTSDVIANLVDGLLENDEYGNLVPSIAEDWTVSKDGLTYTYKLRKDAKWYNSLKKNKLKITRTLKPNLLILLQKKQLSNNVLVFKNFGRQF